MLKKRIIPCLDVKNGRVVKGVNFLSLRDEGDPVELAKFYDQEGADELVFLDITATSEKRDIVKELVVEVARQVFIPFTVGGGIKTLEDMRSVLRAGADKVAINSAAVKDPGLIRRGADEFGSQCIVVAIDVCRNSNDWQVYINGGRKYAGINLGEWLEKASKMGAGEILLTSMDRDGTRKGYDLKLLEFASGKVDIPIIASGGAGNLNHLYEAMQDGRADAVLAASIFHEKDYTIKEVKKFLADRGLPIRYTENGVNF